MLEKMLGILYELAGVHRKIYGISLEKKEAVISNDVQRVGEIVKTEWELLSRIGELEEQRLRLAREMVRIEASAGDSEPTLQEICKHSSPDEAAMLQNVAQELRTLIEEQKKINAENQALIGLHLEYMDYMTNVFLKEPQTSNIYDNSGEVEEEGMTNRGIIDSSV